MEATLTNNNDRTASIVYWTLRHGDFRPEKVDCNITCFYPDEKTMLDQLAKAGNLFDCEQDAIEASIAVRAELNRLRFIRQERQEYNRRNETRRDSSLSHVQTHRPRQTCQVENPNHCDEPQSPTEQTAFHHSRDSFPANDQEIRLTIQFL